MHILWRVGHLHVLPLLALHQLRVRKGTRDEPAQDRATARTERACCEDITGDLPGGALVPEEYNAFVRDKGVEEQNDRMRHAPVGVEVRMLRAGNDSICSLKGLD